MYFIGPDERSRWTELAKRAAAGKLAPQSPLDGIRAGLRPHFHFYLGGLLEHLGRSGDALEWFKAGALEEGGMFNAVMVAYLARHGGRFEMPEMIFADPRPYEHFTTVPCVVDMREKFVRFAAASLPRFEAPLMVMDVGCGDGSLLVLLLNRLLESGRVGRIGGVILVDSSAGMLELAAEKLSKAFPGIAADKRLGRIQEHAAGLPGDIDLALLSLSYHHMPVDVKARHLREMAGKIGNLLLMEMDRDNDTPELRSPELAVSVYESYGPLIDAIFAHDAPIEVSQGCVDNFVMAEVISFLTQPRGKRNDYHMQRGQWAGLFAENLPGHVCRGETTVLAVEGTEFFGCHWGREEIREDKK